MTNQYKNTYDLVVVGGGVAGLYFTYQYLKKNSKAKILLIESKTRLGGRILTNKHKKETYEIGAGRFSNHHTQLKQLLEELKLEKKIIPLKSKTTFFSKEGNPNSKLNFDSLLITALAQIGLYLEKENLEAKDLRKFTLYNLLKVLDPTVAINLDKIYPYYSELHVMNAYDALESFERDFRESVSYSVLKGGLEQIITELHQKIKRKVTIKLADHLCHLEKITNGWKLELGSGKNYLASNLVLALPRKPLLELDALKEIHPLLGLVEGQPLYRIYAKFNKKWLKKKIITDSDLKFIIPINDDGLIMISYTDGPLTEKWLNAQIEGKLENELLKELRKVFPKIEIPDILWIDGSGYWEVGAHYWIPRTNYPDQEALIEKITHPMENLYLVGEAYSSHQAWIEGALRTVELALKNFNENSEKPLLKVKSEPLGQGGKGKSNTKYSLKEVAKHNSRKDGWLVIKGKVYDVTSWISRHPGGDIILRGLGKDATQMFQNFRHSARAEKILKDYQIGILDS